MTADGPLSLSCDALLVAVGARSEPAYAQALTWTPERDPELFGGLLRDLDEGYVKRVAFIVPPGVAWALPAYELALLTAWQAWGMGHDDVEVTVYTPEDAPLGLFGAGAASALRHALEEAGVHVEPGCTSRTHPGHRTDLCCTPATGRWRLSASSPCRVRLDPTSRDYPPTRAWRSVSTKPRQGWDLEGIWAAGDAIAFPIKQGGATGRCGSRGDRVSRRRPHRTTAVSPGPAGHDAHGTRQRVDAPRRGGRRR